MTALVRVGAGAAVGAGAVIKEEYDPRFIVSHLIVYTSIVGDTISYIFRCRLMASTCSEFR